MQIRKTLFVTDEQWKEALEWSRDQVGKKYDKPSIFGFIAKTTQESRKSKELFFCSEFTHAMSVKIKEPILVRVEPFKVFPSMLSYSPLLK